MFPSASHGLCIFHIKQNIKNRFMNDKVTTIFDHASKVYHTSDFDNQMKELRKIHKNAYRYLIKADVKM